MIALRFQVLHRPPPLVDLQFFRMSLESALRHHAARHPRATAWHCASKSTVRQWVVLQVRECSQDATWQHVDLIGGIGEAFSKILQRVVRYRSPLYFTSPMSAEIFELRHILYIRRMKWGNWELIPSREPHLVFDGRSHFSLATALRNVDRACRRLLRSPLATARIWVR